MAGKYYLEAAFRTLQNGGGTFTMVGVPVKHETGYYVGGLVPTSIVGVPEGEHGRTWLADSLKRFVLQHYRAIGHANAYVGTWVHEGNVHIDGSQWVGDREQALELARARGELAVWDCKAGQEVTL